MDLAVMAMNKYLILSKSGASPSNFYRRGYSSVYSDPHQQGNFSVKYVIKDYIYI